MGIHDNAKVSGNAIVSKTPKILTGFKYDIQVFDNVIAIGCKQHTKEEWLAMTNDEISELDGKQDESFVEWVKQFLINFPNR